MRSRSQFFEYVIDNTLEVVFIRPLIKNGNARGLEINDAMVDDFRSLVIGSYWAMLFLPEETDQYISDTLSHIARDIPAIGIANYSHKFAACFVIWRRKGRHPWKRHHRIPRRITRNIWKGPKNA